MNTNNKWQMPTGNRGIAGLSGNAMALVILAVTLGIGATVLSQVQSTQTVNGFAYNSTTRGLSSVDQYSQWITTIAVIGAAAVVLALLFRYFSPSQ